MPIQWAREQGRAAEYLLSFCRAAFAEGTDTGSDAGLRELVERVGLPWAEAQEHLDSQHWRDEVEANRKAMLELGLWGVPSFRVAHLLRDRELLEPARHAAFGLVAERGVALPAPLPEFLEGGGWARRFGLARVG